MKKNKIKEETVYDNKDTTGFIDKKKQVTLDDLGFKLPKEKPTKVVSIRMPTELYNRIKSFSTNMDMPYQAYIKYLISQGLKKDLLKKGAKNK